MIALLAGATGLYAQGTVQFATYLANWNIAVWSPQVATPTVETQGNTSSDIPAGSATYTGVPLGGAGASAGTDSSSYGNGNDYSISLYAASGTGQTLNLADGSPDLLITSHFATTGGTGAANVVNGPDSGLAGSWIGNSSVTIPNSATGTAGAATVQLAVWYNEGGTIASYSDALADGLPTGLSSVASITGLGGANASGPPSTASTLGSITSFSLVTTPEPSTIALGVIGACSFLLRRRKV